MKPPIIQNPKGASFIQRYSQRFLTGAFWVALGLLLRPLLTLGAWLAGGHFFSLAMFQKHGLASLLKVPFVYPMVVVAIGMILIGWAMYNQLRFQNNERRTRQPDSITPAELAAFFGVDKEVVVRWQKTRRIVMNHDETGRPWTDGEQTPSPQQECAKSQPPAVESFSPCDTAGA